MAEPRVPRFPPRRQVLRTLPQAARNAVRFFVSVPTYEFVKLVGNPGAQGGALLFNQRKPDGRFDRQIIAKYYDPDWDEGQSNLEWNILNQLRGAEHIVQLVGMGQFDFQVGRGLIMEYIGHGTLGDAVTRFQENGRRIPERMAWGIFLCLIRACVALRYPPVAARTLYREAMPPPGMTGFVNFRHQDMHYANVLLGGLDMNDNEHHISPSIKLIDFGYSASEMIPPPMYRLAIGGPPPTMADIINNEATPASQHNILAVARLMQMVTTFSEGIGNDYEDVTISGRPLMTNADVDAFQGEPVSDELRELIFRCMACDPQERPPLREVLAACENAVHNYTEADFDWLPDGGAIYESDPVIQNFIKALVLDADLDRQLDRLRSGRRRSFQI